MKALILQVGYVLGSLLVIAAAIGVSAFLLLGRSESASPVGAATVSPTPAIVEHATLPEQEAGLRLADLPGGECQAWLSAYVAPPPSDIDAKVLAAGGPGNWLESGVWIGDAASAAKAFGASWAATSETKPDELWVEIKQDGQITQLKLSGSTTPGGYLIWRETGSARVAPCSSDGE